MAASSSSSSPGKTNAYSGGEIPRYPNPPDTKNGYSGGEIPHYPNPPDVTNPDPETLREQWKFATRKFNRWYSHAWGMAILAGVTAFAVGWFVKGSNPLPSFQHAHRDPDPPPPSNAVEVLHEVI